MRTKNAKRISHSESEYMGSIKEMACGVCGHPGPSEAHHIKQGLHFLAIPLCPDCHRGSFNGIHGQARIWAVKKLDEQEVLNETIRQLLAA